MIAFLTLTACKAPEPAPEELDELVGYLFEHLPDEDPAPLAEGIVNLYPWVNDKVEETLEGYAVNDLSEETITALGDGAIEGTELAGSAVGHVTDRSVDDWAQALIMEDQVEVYGGTYTEFTREWGGDEDCFLGRDCETVDAEVEAVSDYTLIEIVTHSANGFRWVETEEGPALIYRTWLLDEAIITPKDLVEVDRQYYLNVILPTPEGVRTIQVTWVVAKVLGATSEDFALQMMINGMSKNAEKIDAWMDENF